MKDKATKELIKQMDLMLKPSKVQTDIQRVIDNLGAFRRNKSGQIARNEPVKSIRDHL